MYDSSDESELSDDSMGLSYSSGYRNGKSPFEYGENELLEDENCRKKLKNYDEYKIKSDILQKLPSIIKCNVTAASKGIPIDSYFTEGILDPNDLSVEVSGIGKIVFPVTPEVAAKLMAMASPATFGQGTHTKYDRKVRDTHVIPKDKLNVKINKIENILTEIKSKLALGKDMALRAHLYNMLIYEEGQFFDYHQDTEKMDDMVATLVVTVPSAHIGGNLIINHLGKSYVYSTETFKADHVKYLAFYSDCHHKIEKVKEGFRIVLTFNLVLEYPSVKPKVGPQGSQDLIDVIKDYFATYVIEKDNIFNYSRTPVLVYFLDHYYTKESLSFFKLKGLDSQTATVFVSIAKELNLIVHLTSAEVHEMWNDEADVLEGLETSLEGWRSEDNVLLNYKAYHASQEQVCWSIANKQLIPFGVENSGYTGNEGVTEDRWYRRAAIVLWPLTADVKMRFKLDYDNEFKKLTELMKSPDNKKIVKDTVEQVGRTLISEANYESLHTTEFVSIFIKLAVYIQDEKVALQICDYFSNDIFTCKNHNLFCELEEAYGCSWLVGLLNENKMTKFSEVMDFLPLIKGNDERPLIEQILKFQTSNAEKEYGTDKIRRYGALVQAAYKFDFFHIIDDILKIFLSKNWDSQVVAQFYIDYCLDVKTDIIKTAREEIISLLLKDLTVLKEKETLHKKWLSRVKFGNCSCEHCKKMNDFLRSGRNVTKFNLKKDVHDHLLKIFMNKNREVFSMNTERFINTYGLLIKKSIELQNYDVNKVIKLEKLLETIQRDQSTGSSEDKPSVKVERRVLLKRKANSNKETKTTGKVAR